MNTANRTKSAPLPIIHREDFIGLISNLVTPPFNIQTLIIGPTILFAVFVWSRLSSLPIKIFSALYLIILLVLSLGNLFYATRADPGVSLQVLIA
jgi:archaellum biogenesis protein FlaJ (TadC family)